MEFLIYFLISLAIAIIMKPKLEAQKPPSRDEVKFPTNDPQRNISVPFGQVRVNAVSFIFAGNNVRFEKLTKKVDGGLFSSDKNVTIGYQTFVSTAVAIGFSRLFLKRVYFNDEVGLEVADPFGDENKTYEINAEELFLNESDEVKKNGVSGRMKFYAGTQTVRDSHIQSLVGLDALPTFNGMSYAVFEDFYWGNTRTLATPDFEVIRIPKAIDGFEGLIDNGDGTYDANPANILYDVMTDSESYGLGIPDSKIDIDNFKQIAQLLEQEQFGLSLIFESGSSFDDIKKDIEKHCAINVFLSPYTGKWTITANRDNYDVNTLPVFNKGNIKSVKYSRTQPNSLFSEMKVNFMDRNLKYKENSVLAKSLSIEAIRGNPNTQKDNFDACKRQELAAKIAQREILGYNKPLAKLEILTNRDAYGLRIGDLIVVDYDDYNLDGAVFRVIEIDLGQYNKNQIKINLIEDIFSFGDAAISELGSSKWTRPFPEDIPFVYHYEEAPILYGDINNILVATTNHSTRSKGYELYLDEGTEKYLQTSEESTTPYSQLSSQIRYTDTEIVIDKDGSAFDLGRLTSTTSVNRKRGDNLALLIDLNDPTKTEYISFAGATDNGSTYTLTDVWRGCLDTSPKIWNSGSDILFVSYSSIVSNIDPTNTVGTTVTFDLERTFTDIGNIIYLNDEQITFSDRTEKPFYPYALRVNGEFMEEKIPFNELLSLTWAGGNRNNAVLNVTHFIESYSPEAGQTYDLRIGTLDSGSYVNLVSEPNYSGTSFTYSDEIADGGLYNTLQVNIKSKRDGLDSIEEIVLYIDRVEELVDIIYYDESQYNGNYGFVTPVTDGGANVIFASNSSGNIDIFRDNNGLQDISTMTLHDTIITTSYTPIVGVVNRDGIYYCFYSASSNIRCIAYDYSNKTFSDISLGSGNTVMCYHYNKSLDKIVIGRKLNASSTTNFTTLEVDGSLTVTDVGSTNLSISPSSTSRVIRENGSYCYYSGRYWFGVAQSGSFDIYSFDEDDFTATFDGNYSHAFGTSYFPNIQVTERGNALVPASRSANSGTGVQAQYYSGSITGLFSTTIQINDTITAAPSFNLIDDSSIIILAAQSTFNRYVYFSSFGNQFQDKGLLTGYTGHAFTKGGSSFNIIGTLSGNIKNANYDAIY